MGSVRSRVGSDGCKRFVSLYRDAKGRQRSAGTYSTEKLAERAWQRAEDRLAEGRLGDPRRGKRPLRRYVEDEWLPQHRLEARTRETYTYYLNRYILPHLGSMRLVEVLPTDVRAWVSSLADAGASPHVIRSCMSILSAVFTTAFNDQITQLHPCKGVRTPPLVKTSRPVVTPGQFEKLYLGLSDEAMRLLVETDIESGLRWGEVTELRPRDLDFNTRILTVSRVVVELVPEHHPTGGRFIIRDYPKDKEHRKIKLSFQITEKIKAYVEKNSIEKHDLLFPMPARKREDDLQSAVVDQKPLGMTAPNDAGRQYRHGTITGYSTGNCKCQHCKAAYARYRAERRQAGRDQPRNRREVDTDGHIPRRWFRDNVWVPALTAAEIGPGIRVHDLRHAHASWLLAGGADLQVVKERLGHASIRTTERYLHSLPNADDTALNALERTRNGSATGSQIHRRARTRRSSRRRP